MANTSDSREFRILPDAVTLNRAAADEFIRCALDAISLRGRFTAALAGGSTPKAVYSLLAADHADPARRLPWEKIHLFFGDERHVPPTDVESNYRMANESLLSHVPIPSANVHRIMAEQAADAAASQYEKDLIGCFQPAPGQRPRFDLIMLGMGPDGHTASLFPESPALSETGKLVVANWVEKFKSHRITFTFPLLNAAAEVLFLISGESKAEMLRDVVKTQEQQIYPCQKVQPPNGRLLWMIDQPAARLLTGLVPGAGR